MPKQHENKQRQESITTWIISHVSFSACFTQCLPDMSIHKIELFSVLSCTQYVDFLSQFHNLEKHTLKKKKSVYAETQQLSFSLHSLLQELSITKHSYLLMAHFLLIDVQHENSKSYQKRQRLYLRIDTMPACKKMQKGMAIHIPA